MLLRSISMLFALGVITLAVMFGGGTGRLSCILVMLSGFVMFVSGHFRLVVCCSQLASNRLAHFSDLLLKFHPAAIRASADVTPCGAG
jgi:hypothetical protein